MAQTSKWDNFPNGRWGVSRAPSFDAEGSGFVSFSKPKSQKCAAGKKCWGEEIVNSSQISKVFCDFIGSKIKKFPFSEGPLTLESNVIKATLMAMN